MIPLPQTLHSVMQVRRAKVQPGEELHLRQALKNMESRRASVEQCSSIRTTVTGEGEGSGPGRCQGSARMRVSHPDAIQLLTLVLCDKGEPGSGGGGLVNALRGIEVQLSLIMKQEQQMAAGAVGTNDTL